MEPLAALPTVKAHLRVEHADDDVLIGVYLGAASDHVRQNYLVPAAPEPTPKRMIAAVLLMVGDLYANRETMASGLTAITPSLTVDSLLAPFRKVGF